MSEAQERRLAQTRVRVARSPATAFSLALACALLFSSESIRAADPVWYEVRSPHFRTLTDGSEQEAREVLREFEQMRSMFSRLLPNLKLDSGKPFLIVAARDEASVRRLFPRGWQGRGQMPATVFRYGWEREYAMLRLDRRKQIRSQTASYNIDQIYTEYTRSLMYASFRWLPAWVDVGLSEFFGNTQFGEKEISVGAPSLRPSSWNGASPIPMERLIEISWGSPEYRDSNRRRVFSAEAWALVHTLMTEPKQNGKGLPNFINLIDDGKKQKDAFQQAIGDFTAIDREVEQFFRNMSVRTIVIPNPTSIDINSFNSRQVRQEDADAELAAFQLWLDQPEAARQRVELALKQNPKSAVAHETLGFVNFIEGKDVEAAKEFEMALQIDRNLYLAEYYGAMLSLSAPVQSAANIDALRTRLVHVLELKPNFAAAYVELAVLDLKQGSLATALVHARQAQEIARSRPGYYTLTAEILHALDRDSEAAVLARFVGERWLGLHLDEAAALWQKLPPSARTGDPLRPSQPIVGMRTITGKVTSLTCDSKGKTMTVALDGNPITLPVPERIVSVFSDTLWYSRDHSSFCHHLNGLEAVIDYIPSSNPGMPGRFFMHREIPVTPTSR